MAAKPAKTAAAPAAKGNSVSRKRRNALERRSLSKEFKRLFMGSSPSVFKLLTATWKESRKKAPKVAA